MFDRYLVVDGTLKNDVVDGEVVGFSVGVRLSNYRGIYLSLLRGFYFEVDGVQYERDEQFFEINGEAPRSMKQIEKCCWERWNMQDMGILHIKKPGGLAPGKHEIRYLECTLQAYGYMPFDEEYVKNPPAFGTPMCGGKTHMIQRYELELKEG